MNRQEFSQLLASQREQQKCGKNELCRRINFTFHQLQNIENAKNNYNFNLVNKYLVGLQLKLYITTDKKQWHDITQYDDFVFWLTKSRSVNYTQRSLAASIGVAYLTIANIERKATVISIDTFLKIINVLGCEIKIGKCS